MDFVVELLVSILWVIGEGFEGATRDLLAGWHWFEKLLLLTLVLLIIVVLSILLIGGG